MPDTIRVLSPSHRVKVVAEERTDVVVEGKADERQIGQMLSIEGVRGALLVRVPLGTDVQVGTQSSRVEVEGAVGHLAVSSSSGRVVAEAAETADIRTSSGRIELGSVAGEARLRTSSGRVVVDSCDRLDVATEDGRIEVRDARGHVDAHCVNGRVDVRLTNPADVVAETVNGRIKVTMPAGTKVHRPTAGEASGDRPSDCDCTVTARSVNGRVVVGER